MTKSLGSYDTTESLGDHRFAEGASNTKMSGGRHLLPSAVSLRTQRATFTALGSSLHEGIV
ncbi:hypothetical protein VCR20J5_710063 [Vibrio crassostreae]|uniref:hypothetical protein n=1 Tax=Vibrio crassostreae TaxID=246167 RepID=UPI000633BF72|nr:hypothetical protein [Vibrio crassostreae]CDT64813.1 hypothetical protein VCR20J5_710063 [Vibrio crassostreae]